VSTRNPELSIEVSFREFARKMEQAGTLTKKQMREAGQQFLRQASEQQKALEAAGRTGLETAEAHAKQLKELGKAIGGPFQGVANLLEDVTGAASAGLAPMAAVAAGFVAAGVAAVGLASYVGDAIHRHEELAATLSYEAASALSGHVGALQEAAAASAGLDRAQAQLQLTIAGELAPTVTTATDAYAGLTLELARAADANSDFFSRMYEASREHHTVGPLIEVYEYLADIGREARSTTGAFRDLWGVMSGMDSEGRPASLLPAGVPSVGVPEMLARVDSPQTRAAPRQAVELDSVLEAKVMAQVAALNQTMDARLERISGVNDQLRGLSASYRDDLLTEVEAIDQRYDRELRRIQDLADAKAHQDVVDEALSEAQARRARDLQAHYDDLAASAQQQAQDTSRAALDQVQTMSGWFTSVASLASEGLNRVVESYRDSQGRMTAEGKRRALELFWAQKAIAISTIVVQGGQAFMQALGSGPPPYNFIQAGITAGLTIAQAALVGAEQPPVYDVGGMVQAPDHRLIMAQPGEAVLNQRAVAEMGAEEIAARNSGRMGGADVVALMLRNEVLDAVDMDRSRRLRGASSRAAREASAWAGQRRRW
jgi:hypothetical protein